MKQYLYLLLSLFLSSHSSFAQKPTKAQIRWQNSELAVLVSYDLHVFDNKRYIQKENRVKPIKNINMFNPTDYDTDQWARSISNMGAKIAVLTATHETGFALYQSDVNPYCMKVLKWKDGKGDIVKDFVESCRKYGIQPGIYIGIRWNSLLGVYDFKVQGDNNDFTKNRQEFYNYLCEEMTRELVSRYGDLAMVWYDGGASGPDRGGPNVLPIVEKYQKDFIFYRNTERSDIRWAGNEEGFVNYPSWGRFPFKSTLYLNVPSNMPSDIIRTGSPDGKYYIPAMADTPLRGYNGKHEWFWEPGDENYIYPLENLMDMYHKSVGRNATLIIGITPNDKGLIPKADSIRMAEFGNTIKQTYSHPVGQIKGSGATFSIKFDTPEKISKIVVQEDLNAGECVNKFRISGKKSNGKWIQLVENTNIGNKYIERLKSSIDVVEVKLQILDFSDTPNIANFAVYK